MFGTYFYHSLNIEYVIPKKTEFPDVLKNCPIHPTINDFLSSTNYAFPFVKKRKNGYFILWKDLRFRQKKFFPYLAIIFLSSDGRQIYSTFSGWCYSLKQLRKVMRKIQSGKTLALVNLVQEIFIILLIGALYKKIHLVSLKVDSFIVFGFYSWFSSFFVWIFLSSLILFSSSSKYWTRSTIRSIDSQLK